MIRRLTRSAIAACLIIAAGITATPTSSVAAAPSCPEIYFLGAAGSGESTNPTDQYLGMGPEVYSAYIG